MDHLFSRITASSGFCSFKARERVFLALITVAGALLRIWYQHHRAFTGDEIGTLIYMKKPVSYICTHYGTWLSMNYFILMEKGIAHFAGTNSWVLTAIPILASVCAIPLTAELASLFVSRRAALIAGALAAVNPYLIIFGTQIRCYSVVVLLSLCLLIAFWKWTSQKTLGRGVLCAIFGFALCLTHLTGIYFWISITGLVLANWLSLPKTPGWTDVVWRDIKQLAVPFCLAGALLGVIYFPMVHDITVTNKEWTSVPPTKIDYLPYLFAHFFVSGFLELLSFGLFTLGIWTAAREKNHLLVLTVFAIVPICFMSWQGVAHYPWAYTRFLIYCLPLILVFMAEGIESTSKLAVRSSNQWAHWAVACMLAISWTPTLTGALKEKEQFPWLRISECLKHEPAEAIFVANNFLDNLNLRPFAEGSGRKVWGGDDSLPPSLETMNDPVRLVYINSSKRVATKEPRKKFGRVELITYTGKSGHEVIEKLRADLLQTTNGEAAENLEAHYCTLRDICRNLGETEQAERMALLKDLSHQFDDNVALRRFAKSEYPKNGHK
jgi:hypothetical protein